MSTNLLVPIKPEDLAAVSGGTTQATSSDQLTQLLTQIQTSLTNLTKNNNNGFSSSDMMLLMMVMLGSSNHSYSFFGGGGGGGYYGGFGGLPPPPPCLPGGCKGW